MPCIILICGTVASGKSTMTDMVIEHIEKKANEKLDVIKFQIDDLVVNDAIYKKRIDKLLKLRNKVTHEDYINAFDDVKLRLGCKRMKENVKKQPCSKFMIGKIQAAFGESRNVAIEFNYSKLKELKKELAGLPRNYKIIMAYALVDYDKLVVRNRMRTQKTMQRYLKNKEKNQAPRFAKLEKNKVRTVRNRLKRMASCFFGGNKELCEFLNVSNTSASNLLLYSNNGANMKLIYDSDEDTAVTKREVYAKIDNNLVI